MITYATGAVALPGDRVDNDGSAGVVEAVIDSQEERTYWDFDESGLMIQREAYGLMFEPVDNVAWDAIVLSGRADTPPLGIGR